MNATHDVSVVIVNWNTVDILRDCLNSIYKETRGITFETLVIDNASSDSSVHMVRNEFPNTILIANKDNRGFAAANNQGLRQAQGRYLLLLNSDTLILDGAIQKTVRYADAAEGVGVLGCQVWENETTIQYTCFRFPTPWNLFCVITGLAKLAPKSRLFGGDRMREWDRRDEREVEVVSGMFMLVRRAAFEQVGYLDESFFIYCEEADWCYRMKKAGWRNVFWPGARIVHRDGGGKSTEKVNIKMEVQLVRSTLFYIRKHYGPVSEALVRFTILVTALVKLCFYSLAHVISPNRFQGRSAKFSSIATYAISSKRARSCTEG